MNISSTMIHDPIEGPVSITVEVQEYKGVNCVMIHRINQRTWRSRVTYMSVKEAIATNNLLNNLSFPKER